MQASDIEPMAGAVALNACCASVLTATKCVVGRWVASEIARKAAAVMAVPPRR